MGTHAFVSLSNFTNTYEKRRKRNVNIRTTNKYSHKRHTFRRNYRSVSLTCNKNKYHFSKIYGKFAQILETGIHLLLLNNEEKKIEDFLPLQPSKLNLIVHQPSFSRPRFAFVSLCYYGTALCLIAPRPGRDHLKRVSRAPLFPSPTGNVGAHWNRVRGRAVYRDEEIPSYTAVHRRPASVASTLLSLGDYSG